MPLKKRQKTDTEETGTKVKKTKKTSKDADKGLSSEAKALKLLSDKTFF